MPKDQRLYMTFPNDFWMHPRVAPLPVEAKWTFVEMNGYSRMQDLDGVIPAVMAERLWDASSLDALTSSIDAKPLVLRRDTEYVIREYAQHQQTTEDRESLSRKRSEAGAAGRAKQLAGKPPANSGQVPGQIRAETETEIEKRTISPAVSESEFDASYSHWPKKINRKQAFERFKTAVKKRGKDLLLADITRFGDAYAKTTETKFVPALGVWLSAERWTDDLPGGTPTTQAINGRREEIRDGIKWVNGKPTIGGRHGMTPEQYERWSDERAKQHGGG